MSKTYFENFWDAEQNNELFVYMPFHENLNEKFDTINKAAVKVGFERAHRVDRNLATEGIPSKILDGIGNSKVLLFDLSDDPKSSECAQVNGNVLYELGIAMAIREKTDILIIRDEASKSNIPFNIEQLPIQSHGVKISEEWLVGKLSEVLRNQEWHRSKRVSKAAKSLDTSALQVIHKQYGNILEGEADHFNIGLNPTPVLQLAVMRLLDLDMISLGTGNQAREASYNWTGFGKAVIKSLGIEKRKS